MIHSLGKIPARIVVVVGLGKKSEFNLDKIRNLVAEFCRALRRLNCRRIATIVHGGGVGCIEPEAAAQAVAEGSLLGLYRFCKYMTKEAEDKDVEELLIVERDEKKLMALKQGCSRGVIVAESAMLARDLVNEPANNMTPTALATVAERLG